MQGRPFGVQGRRVGEWEVQGRSLGVQGRLLGEWEVVVFHPYVGWAVLGLG